MTQTATPEPNSGATITLGAFGPNISRRFSFHNPHRPQYNPLYIERIDHTVTYVPGAD